MNPLTLLHILEPITTAAARIYVIAGEVFTVAVLLHGLKLLAGLIEGTYKAAIHTYAAGKIAGEYYFTYLHPRITEGLLAAFALTVILYELALLGAHIVWTNRGNYLPTINRWRDKIGDAFVYHSPATLA